MATDQGITVPSVLAAERNPPTFVVDRPIGCGDFDFIHFSSPVRIIIGDRPAVVTRPHACLIYRPRTRQWYDGAGHAYDHDWFHFRDDAAGRRVAAGCGLPLDEIFYPLHHGFVRPLVQEIQQESITRNHGWEAMLTCAVTRLFTLLARGRQGGDQARSPAQEQLRTRIHHVRTTVLESPGLNWTVAGLARNAGLSVSRFNTLHRTFFEQPPKRFLQDVRLNQARVLLTNASLSMAEVAERCGFSSLYHFSHSFTRAVGCPPSRYYQLMANAIRVV